MTRPRQHRATQMNERLSAPTGRASEAAARLKARMQVEGAPDAYQALLDVAKDKSAPAQARATAATTIIRAAGFFEKMPLPEEKPEEEMSAVELLRAAEAVADRLEAARVLDDDLEDDTDEQSEPTIFD